MALVFSEIEAVKFGSIEARPVMTREAQLRLGQLKISPTALPDAYEVLSRCFGEKAAQIRAFMEKNLGVGDLSRLQIYLMQGASALENYDRTIAEVMTEEMKRAVDEARTAQKGTTSE